MNKDNLFILAIILITLGLTLIGLGLGILFSKCWVGVLIGLGIGMSTSAILILKTVRRLIAYEKK